jgi:hypothetical protein
MCYDLGYSGGSKWPTHRRPETQPQPMHRGAHAAVTKFGSCDTPSVFSAHKLAHISTPSAPCHDGLSRSPWAIQTQRKCSAAMHQPGHNPDRVGLHITALGACPQGEPHPQLGHAARGQPHQRIASQAATPICTGPQSRTANLTVKKGTDMQTVATTACWEV